MLDVPEIHILSYDEQGVEVGDEIWTKDPEPEGSETIESPWLKDAKGILLFKAKIPITQDKVWTIGEWVPIWETQFPWRRGKGRVFADPWCIRGIWFPWRKPRPKKIKVSYAPTPEWNIAPQELLGR